MRCPGLNMHALGFINAPGCVFSLSSGGCGAQPIEGLSGGCFSIHLYHHRNALRD